MIRFFGRHPIRVLTLAMAIVPACADRGGEPVSATTTRPTSQRVKMTNSNYPLRSTESTDKPKRIRITQSTCKLIRTAIEARNFSDWQGIAAECSAQDLFDDVPDETSDRPHRTLGKLDANWVILKLPGYYRPMASFRDGRFILFDAMNPDIAEKASTLTALFGKPAATLDWWYGTLEMKSSQLVYPNRGITLYLNPETDNVLHVALYSPTDLDNWIQTLQPNLRKTTHKASSTR